MWPCTVAVWRVWQQYYWRQSPQVPALSCWHHLSRWAPKPGAPSILIWCTATFHVPGRAECNTLSRFEPVSIKKTACLQSSVHMCVISQPIFTICTRKNVQVWNYHADHSGRAVYGTNCLRSLGRWGCRFESHSRHGCLYVRFFCVCVVLCVGSGLATGWSPVQVVLPTLYRLRNWKSGQGPSKGCKPIAEWKWNKITEGSEFESR
jgi:hypothetical protein